MYFNAGRGRIQGRGTDVLEPGRAGAHQNNGAFKRFLIEIVSENTPSRDAARGLVARVIKPYPPLRVRGHAKAAHPDFHQARVLAEIGFAASA